MSSLLGKIVSLSGGIYAPKEILRNEPVILHISDTPSSLYSALEKLIHKIEPTYIIHTGNFADNSDLSFNSKNKKHYTKSVTRFIKILEDSSAKEIYGVFGNNDCPSILTSTSNRIHWIEDFSDICIENINIRISHNPKYSVSNKANISLFGHDLDVLSFYSETTTYLNGIEAIHVIDIETMQITHLEYPIGTNDTRLKVDQLSV